MQRNYKNLIWQDSNRMSGTICFYGTRVPVEFMFDYLRNGESIEQFSIDYGVQLEVGKSVLSEAANGLDQLLISAA
jgi:uncharacterized protein (DUF433 family)